ncbi:MAG: CesT family type III secretion system chaperone [Gammaproteobacteria bacterium]
MPRLTLPHRCARLLALLVALTGLPPATLALEVATLGALLERLGLEGGDGYWRVVAGGRAVLVMADERHDRLRIQAHVTAAEALDEALLRRALTANFATAADARYAIEGTTLWSLYVHPLASLGATDFADALAQVVNLAADFGHGYGSGKFAAADTDGATPGRALLDALRARATGAAP